MFLTQNNHIGILFEVNLDIVLFQKNTKNQYLDLPLFSVLSCHFIYIETSLYFMINYSHHK